MSQFARRLSSAPPLSALAPQIRANWCKFTVRYIKQLSELERRAVFNAMGDELREHIRAAGPLQWLDAETFFDLCSAIRTGLGPNQARAFWRKSLGECLEEPFIRPLVKGATFLWGKSPEAPIRRTPQAWQLVSKNCGALSAVDHEDENCMVLEVRGLPRVARGNQGLVHLWEGAFRGHMDAFDCDGTVEAQVEHFESRGDLDYVIRWHAL